MSIIEFDDIDKCYDCDGQGEFWAPCVWGVDFEAYSCYSCMGTGRIESEPLELEEE